MKSMTDDSSQVHADFLRLIVVTIALGSSWQGLHVRNNVMLIIGSAPVNFFYFIFLLKTKESASLAWLFLHTGRWPACIESVFYWIC